MGKVIKKKLNGMSWWMKTSLVLLLTLTASTFMYQGWYKPAPAQAATVTYGVTVPNVLTTGIDGLAQFPTAAASVTTAPTVRGNMSTTLTTSGASYRPTTGMTSGTPVTLLKLYSPAYASAQTITAPIGDFAIRGYNATDTWTFHVYSHNPAGVAGNKTLMYSSNTTTSGTGATVAVAPTYTLVSSAMPAGYKLLVEVVYTPGGTLYTPRVYIDGAAAATWSRLTVTETAAGTAGTLAVSTGTQTLPNEAVVNATVTVNRTGGTTGAVTVAYATADGTALAGQDYTSTTGTLSWAAGDATAKTITIPIINDTYDEGNETFAVNLSTPTNGAILGTATQTVTITDDDATPTIGFTATTSTGNKTITPATFTVSLSSVSALSTSVAYSTTNGTAAAGTDYTATSGTLTIPALSASGTISVPILAASNGGTFTITVSSPTNSTLRAGFTTHTYTITATAASTINNCAGCHGYKAPLAFLDGASRNDAGKFQGSHNTHVIGQVMNCSGCHTVPTTETTADHGHSDGKIQMAGSISGGAYTVASPITVSNTFAPGTCNGTSCHANVYGTAAIPSPTWGSSASGCAACHNTFPIGVNGPVTGSHANHAGTTCISCHNAGTTATNAPTTGHADGNVTVTNGYPTTVAKHTANTGYTGSCTTSYCHSQGTSKTLNAGENRTLQSAPVVAAVWGTTTLDCNGCHNSPPNYTTGTITLGGTAKANSHQGTTHAAQLCTRCHNSVTGTGPYTTTTGHADGLYTVAAANVGYTYAVTGGTCNATGTGCHSTTSIAWGASLACLDCHGSTTLSAPNATTLAGAAISRRGISTEFGLTSNHTRSRGAITSEDCGVCHMEGVAATGAKNTAISPTTSTAYHGNGLVELRDADTGTTIDAQTFTSPATWVGKGSPAVFTQFKRNLAATPESETALYYPTAANTIFQVNSAIQVKHCLSCHDAGGATNALARITAGVALKPFNATVALNPGGGVLDVFSQFASTNRSFHPVTAKQNNGYAGGTRMVAPWNGVAKTGTTTVYGPLVTCWDCHAGSGATGTLTATTTHGATPVGTDVVAMRGRTYVTPASQTGVNLYCFYCHSNTLYANDGLHSTGSAFALQSRGSMPGVLTCTICHSSKHTVGQPARPYGAADAHGFNTKDAGGAFAAGQGYAFIRSSGFYGSTYTQTVRTVGTPAYTSTNGQCNGFQAGGPCAGRSGMGTYTPGGVY